MNSKYRVNKFSANTVYNLNTSSQYNTLKTTKPRIDHLMKRIIDDRKKEKKIIVAFGSIFFSIILIFHFFQ